MNEWMNEAIHNSVSFVIYSNFLPYPALLKQYQMNDGKIRAYMMDRLDDIHFR